MTLTQRAGPTGGMSISARESRPGELLSQSGAKGSLRRLCRSRERSLDVPSMGVVRDLFGRPYGAIEADLSVRPHLPNNSGRPRLLSSDNGPPFMRRRYAHAVRARRPRPRPRRRRSDPPASDGFAAPESSESRHHSTSQRHKGWKRQYSVIEGPRGCNVATRTRSAKSPPTELHLGGGASCRCAPSTWIGTDSVRDLSGDRYLARAPARCPSLTTSRASPRQPPPHTTTTTRLGPASEYEHATTPPPDPVFHAAAPFLPAPSQAEP
jgi:hypothetical protein